MRFEDLADFSLFKLDGNLYVKIPLIGISEYDVMGKNVNAVKCRCVEDEWGGWRFVYALDEVEVSDEAV